LVLLRLEAMLTRGFGAELQKAPDLVAEFRLRAVFGLGEIGQLRRYFHARSLL
jgi:hypothetical protein